ncbi:hypothetical protein OAA86_00165 [Rhodospirillales bacterium]|nr:hypothetical protein [Rhodospirillales bacterium]
MSETTISTNEELCTAILDLIEQEKIANPVSYNTDAPYQCYERIGFKGMRWSVEKRIREYGLEQFFNPEHAVLDIGSNFGFFVAEFGLHCRLAHGIEPTSYLNKIGELTSEFVGSRDKVEFFDETFERFENSIHYDTIFSLAAFFTADGRERSTADSYFGKINAMLNENGHLFYESTSFIRDESFKGYPACISAIEAIKSRMELVRDWETPSGSPGYRRHFAIARKKH